VTADGEGVEVESSAYFVASTAQVANQKAATNYLSYMFDL
jgi:hypothetical protein